VCSSDLRLLDRGIIGGLDCSRYFPERKNHWLLCATEVTSKAQIDALANELRTL
jgi:hypothetical protein